MKLFSLLKSSHLWQSRRWHQRIKKKSINEPEGKNFCKIPSFCPVYNRAFLHQTHKRVYNKFAKKRKQKARKLYTEFYPYIQKRIYEHVSRVNGISFIRWLFCSNLRGREFFFSLFTSFFPTLIIKLCGAYTCRVYYIGIYAKL